MVPAQISYPPELPVSRKRDEIARAIRDHQVVIVAGETGSGKTTQLPKICLELGRQSIGHTQPRRIAARTIAERVAEELGEEVGGLVGYRVRFTDRVGRDTRIKLMTDGVLLNEIHHDRLLTKYDTIIIDEAHERSLTIDFLLGYLRNLLPQRPDLRVIITSATIDPESFARHFSGADGSPAPIVEVSGRTFPVEIRYRPLVPDGPEPGVEDDLDETVTAGGEAIDLIDGITAALDELAREEPGDVLVFLSGENEIRDAQDALEGRLSGGRLGGVPTEVLPLYGRLSAADQHRVFRPSRAGVRRRIVLATNVAETSLTVPGIKYVVDAGTARISRYSTRAKVQRLPIEPISQASARQRSGRSGRTSEGIAIRLYSEQDFQRRPEYTEPEILRTNLASVILQMLALGLGDIEAFPFLTPPDRRGVKDGLELLRELGAVEPTPARSEPARAASRQAGEAPPGATGDGDGGTRGEGATRGWRITQIGRQLTQLPIDPRYGRMILETKRRGNTREVLAIVAGLSIQDPRERPLDKRAQADQLHARFTDPSSDFLSLLNLWNHLGQKAGELSGNQFRRLCKAEFINFLRVREWQDVYRQLERTAKQLGLHVGAASVNPDGIHRSLLSGLLSHIGLRDAQKKDYAGARGQRFLLFPGSGLAKRQPQAVMAAELVETSRLFARTVAAIDPAWAEPLAGELLKRSYSEPHWEKKQGAAVAYERVTLYGVPLVPRRRVQYARIDPAHARDLFIRHGLVEGDWEIERFSRDLFAFDRANRRLRAELEELEERTRRRDILYDDEAIVEFYDRRLPGEATSLRAFEKWWRRARTEQPDLLTMTPENLAGQTTVDEDDFPTVWRQGDQTLALSYRFEPGSPEDGVTVHIPLPLLPRISPAGFDWLVPGLREELVAALIKTLPKAIRRNVVPAADWARRLLDGVPADAELTEQPLTEFLAARIQRETYTPVGAGDFDPERLAPHLRMTFAVENEQGRVLARGKELETLQHKLRTRTRESVARVSRPAPNALERAGLTGWDFDELPRFVDTRHGGNVIRAYPALVDEGQAAAIRLMSTPADQAAATPAGVRRLLALNIPSPLPYVREHLRQQEKLTLALSPYRTVPELFADLLDACLDDGLRQLVPDGLVWAREDFERVRDRVSAGLVDALYRGVALVAETLAAARDAERALKQATSMAALPAVADARGQLAALVYPGFVGRTGLAQLRHLPRYLRAVAVRLEKLPSDIARDRVWMTEVQNATARYEAAGGRLPLPADAPEQLRRARWLLEELRVSLFAQQLGTAEPVSPQRIQKALAG